MDGTSLRRSLAPLLTLFALIIPAAARADDADPPAVTGDVSAGSKVSCSPGGWDASAGTITGFEIVWYLDDAPAATGLELPAAQHLGRAHRPLHGRGRGASGVLSAPSSVGPGDRRRLAPVKNLSLPYLGATSLDGRLTCVPGSWQGAAEFTYEWMRDGAVIGTERPTSGRPRTTGTG